MRYNFTLEPRTIDFFKEPLKSVFTEPENSVFLQYPFLFRYFAENEMGELLSDAQITDDRKFILIRDAVVIIGTNETRLAKHVTSHDDMKGTILKYFPKFSKEDVERALQCFNRNKNEPA